MKRIIILVGLLLLTVSIVIAVGGMTKEQKKFYNECKKNCSTEKRIDKQECNYVSSDCRDNCKVIRGTNDRTDENTFLNCTSSCKNLNTTILNQTELEAAQKDCKKNCSYDRREMRKEYKVSYQNCTKTCQDEKQNCKQRANDAFLICTDNCTRQALYNGTNGNETDNNYGNETSNNDGNETSPEEGNQTGLEDGNETNDPNQKVFCPKLRPTVCFDLYQPVCSNRNITYSNGCYACADRKTRWYRLGDCENPNTVVNTTI